MYSESDIDNAVGAGVLSRETANALRNYVAVERDTPAVDEEHFRLLTGFNDIFVSIALVLMLAAVGQLGTVVHPAIGGLGVAGVGWALAEYFTRRRRMALPSILLLLAFVGGVAAMLSGIVFSINPNFPDRINAMFGAGIALISAGAAYLHWRHFMVPITVAAGALALAGVALGLVLAAVPASKDAIYPISLVAGFAVFALAMWWDMSDKQRRTRRADVAFWLHLAAAPLIAHPVFQMLGVFNADIGLATAAIVLVLYMVFAFVALAVDRRALLVSSLVYVLYALYAVFISVGSVELSAAFTGLVIGSALLTLSAFWHPMRKLVVATLGTLSDRLPPVQTMAVA